MAHTPLDHTHDPALRSWVASANGHGDVPLQNLPIGVVTPPVETSPGGGVAIGDLVLDLAAAHRAGSSTARPRPSPRWRHFRA